MAPRMEISERIERVEWAARRWVEANKKSFVLFGRMAEQEDAKELANTKSLKHDYERLKNLLEEYAYFRAGLVEIVEATEGRGDYAEHLAHYSQIEEFKPDDETGFIPFDKRTRIVWFFYLYKAANEEL